MKKWIFEKVFKKNILKIILFISLVPILNAYSQENSTGIKAEYIGEIILDFEKVKNIVSSNQREILKNEISKGIYINYTLINNGKYSFFSSNDKIYNSQNDGDLLLDQLLESEKKPVIKDFINNVYYKELNVFSNQYLIKDSIPNYNWRLTKETTILNGFNVKKALGKDKDVGDIIVWYTIDIPVKDGPFIFANLPGLIIKAEMNTPYFKTVFELKNIEILDKQIEINIPKKGKILSHKEFQNEMEILNNRYNDFTNNGVSK